MAGLATGFEIIVVSLFFFSATKTFSTTSISNGNSDVLCVESERNALLRFKADLQDPSDRLSSWVLDSDCCKWYGIHCNNSTGHITKLNLANSWDHESDSFENSKLKGKISNSILDLRHLSHLDLSYNDFGWNPIPSFLGSLVSLNCLNLTSAGFQGLIPHELGNLSNLHHLCLRGNSSYYRSGLYSEKLQWLQGLHSLLTLDLSYSNLNKVSDWLLEINMLSSLQELYLSNCQLTHITPLSHANFTSLSILDISSNSFSDFFIPKWIFSLTSVTSLNLFHTHFKVQTPRAFQNLSALTYLDLSEVEFNSSIPNCLYNLQHLKYLSLFNVHLHGRISHDIANLTNIVLLDLSYNELEGNVPASMGTLCNLRSIDLSENKFVGELSEILKSFSRCLLDNLISLSLSYNNISGPIPESIGSLSSLIRLDLSGNQLNGTLPKSIGSLSSLETLYIYGNHLKGIVSEVHFANLTNLKELRMSENNLVLSFDTEWSPPFQLDALDLSSCILGPQFPKWLKSQTKLQYIDLSNARISDTAPDWFWNLSFWYLNLNHNKISGTIPDFSHNKLVEIIVLRSNMFHGPLPLIPSTVSSLDLSNNFFSGNISHFLYHSESQGNHLQVLHVGDNLLSGNIPNCWTKWRSLLAVNMSNNNLFGKLPSSMGSLRHLHYLHLRNNSLSGEIPPTLQNCEFLMILDLSLNAFNANIPAWMGTSFTLLVILNLRSNELSGSIPKEICHLSHLQIMDIANNNLVGHIPHCFYNFEAMATNQPKYFPPDVGNIPFGFDIMEEVYVVTKGKEFQYDKILLFMVSIDLADNNLSGKIPQEITDLLKLKSLNLSGNHLEGTIPEKIGSMTNMESLDLSRNRLSGQIPRSMSNLTFLSHLNLSCNNLSGEIPTGTQLQSLDPSSFIGNQLCGPPLTRSCRTTPKTENNGEEAKEGDENHLIDEWFYLSVGVGYLVGFSGIWVPLFISKTWRLAYVRHLDSLWNQLVSCFCC